MKDIQVTSILVVSSSIATLVLACILYFSGTSIYGSVIHSETKEWSKPPIIDIISADQACPAGYEQLQAQFQGTKTICKDLLTYSYGKCGKKSSYASYTIYGLDEEPLKVFDSKYICFKRGNSNYHQISKARNTTCNAPAHFCGPRNDKDFQYCYNDNQCPLNAFYMLSKNQTFSQQLENKKFTYNLDWNAFQIFNQSSRNPLINIYINLSPPCGDQSANYFVRNKSISDIYKEQDSCYFKMNGKPTHPEFYETGFHKTEYSILSDNKLIDDIKVKVPDYNQKDLQQNEYKLYYKNYAPWKLACQEEYSTEDIEETGEHLLHISSQIQSLLIVSCVFLFADMILIVIVVGAKNNLSNKLLMTIQLLIRFAFLALIAFFYWQAYSSLRHVDIEQLEYATENSCSGDVLNYSFFQVSEDHHAAINKTLIGMVLSLTFIFVSNMTILRNILISSKEDDVEHHKLYEEDYNKKVGDPEQMYKDKNDNQQ